MISLVLPHSGSSSCLLELLETMPVLCSQVEAGNGKWTQQKRRLPQGGRLSVSDCFAAFSMSTSAHRGQESARIHPRQMKTEQESGFRNFLQLVIDTSKGLWKAAL